MKRRRLRSWNSPARIQVHRFTCRPRVNWSAEQNVPHVPGSSRLACSSGTASLGTFFLRVGLHMQWRQMCLANPSAVASSVSEEDADCRERERWVHSRLPAGFVRLFANKLIQLMYIRLRNLHGAAASASSSPPTRPLAALVTRWFLWSALYAHHESASHSCLFSARKSPSEKVQGSSSSSEDVARLSAYAAKKHNKSLWSLKTLRDEKWVFRLLREGPACLIDFTPPTRFFLPFSSPPPVLRTN